MREWFNRYVNEESTSYLKSPSHCFPSKHCYFNIDLTILILVHVERKPQSPPHHYTRTDIMNPNMEEAKAHLKEHSWVKIPSVLTKADAAHTLNRLWKAKATSEANGEATFQPILDPDPSSIRVFYLPELDPLFRSMLTHPTGIELTKAVLGDRFLVSNFSANIARPGSQSMALHSDQKHRPSRTLAQHLGRQRNLVSHANDERERRNTLHSRLQQMDMLGRRPRQCTGPAGSV